MFRLKTFILTILIFQAMLSTSYPQEIMYNVDKLADSIFLAEGGSAAEYLYGIRSIPYETEEEARRYCKNTIRNQQKRHRAHDCGNSYIVCLRNRYCPLGAKNDPKGLNSNWIKNVLYFYNKADNGR